MSLNDFKKKLETTLQITEWSPSDRDLKLIASRLSELPDTSTKNDVALVVLEVVNSYEAICQEGIDNSDLKMLLLLAKKQAEQ